jgi:hypothetical protein
MTRTRLRICDRYRLIVLRKARPPFCSRVTGRTSFRPDFTIWF